MSLFFNLLAKNATKLPYKRRLEYIKSTGTQYIDTGITPNANTRMEIAFTQIVEVPGYINFMCGSRSGQGVDNFGVYFSQGSIVVGFSSQTQWNLSYTMGKNIELGKNTYIDGTLVQTFTDTTFTLNAKPIYLFGRNNSGSVEFSKCDIAYCRIWHGNVLVCDLIPVLDLNNVACMYDQVTKQFFYNQGSGQFLYPHTWEERQLNWIQPTGTQYIDTGVICDNCTKLEVEFMSPTTYGVGCVCGTATIGAIASYFAAPMLYGNDTRCYLGGTWSLATQEIGARYKTVLTKTGCSLYKNGVLEKTVQGFRTISSSRTLYMFAGNEGTSTPTASEYSKNVIVYSIKIYGENDTLIKDYIPMLNETGNAAGMYDIVSGEWKGNQGTGQFLYELKNQ